MLKLEIIGNLGSDAEIKKIGEKSYVAFSVAHTDFSKNERGEKVQNTIWISVLWYGDGGKLLPYLTKGARVFIRGNQKVNKYTDKDGNIQFALNAYASEVQVFTKSENSTTGTEHQEVSSISSDEQEYLPF